MGAARVVDEFAHARVARKPFADDVPDLVDARGRGKPRVLARRRPMGAPTRVQVTHQGRGAAEAVHHDARCLRAAFHFAPHVPLVHDVEQKVVGKLRIGASNHVAEV